MRAYGVNERYDTRRKWSLTDKLFGARDSKEIARHAKGKKCNCKNNPLFSFIPISHVIFDTLHLFLRISDNLIDLLITELCRQDAIDKNDTFSKGFCRNKYKHMAGYETSVKSLGISFEWKINKDTKTQEYRDLTGPEKLLSMQNVNCKSLLPNSHATDDLQVLSSSFMDIMVSAELCAVLEESV